MGGEGSSGRVPGGAQQQEPAPHHPAARRAGQDLSRLFQRLLAEAAPGGQEPAAGPAVHTRPADQADRHRLTLPRQSTRGHQATPVPSTRSPPPPPIPTPPALPPPPPRTHTRRAPPAPPPPARGAPRQRRRHIRSPVRHPGDAGWRRHPEQSSRERLHLDGAQSGPLPTAFQQPQRRLIPL